ncbi:hypothetical protein C8034_v007451 [Colletotrichum sidae]|uniref:Heterokaryon incompatibility domain-containing protein n=1 Tax=Colletotrichum sidae TaxID=1347389 RepID=A0A4R8T3J1_9PEZI|nr:hypothetical protein C8034_v007451 [Colletotrichum sidae]
MPIWSSKTSPDPRASLEGSNSTPGNAQGGRRSPWRRSKPSKGLCKVCSEMNFEQFTQTSVPLRNQPPSITTTVIFLFGVIKNRRNSNCKFCTLLFDSIALPRNDPFESEAIKSNMPPELVGKSFETWVAYSKWHNKITKVPHPFGVSRDKIRIEQDPSVPGGIREVRDRDLEVAENAGLMGSAAATGAALHAASQETNKGKQAALTTLGSTTGLFTSALTLMKQELPVVVTIKMHNTEDADVGLLEINVLGYGRKERARLSVLSEFNLRVASSFIVQGDDGMSLRYGKSIEDKIKVEDDCRRWLEHCVNKHHKICEEPEWFSKLEPPTGSHFRLIDVRTREIVPIFLQQQSELPQYAALSYVWGETGRKALNLHLEDLSTGRYRIDEQVRTAAKTVENAMEVSRRLGLQYLWADCLCVIQKDDDGEDEPNARQSQLDQMGSIFGHASVIIVAATGEDAEAGLPGVGSPRNTEQAMQGVTDGVNVIRPVEYDRSYGKWDTRAWTLQEKLLSRRKLVFGKQYVGFHCRHGILREDMPAIEAGNGPPPIPHLSMPPTNDKPSARETWHEKLTLLRSPCFSEYTRLVEEYTCRDSSNNGDILAAISGLLKVLEDMRHLANVTAPLGSQRVSANTLYGLPEEFLDLALLWHPPADMGTYLTKRKSDQFPSWSWAGWEVSRDPAHERDAVKTHKAHPGIRWEDPFWVSGNDDLSLKKYAATGTNVEERFKPLLRWYKCSKPATRLSSSPRLSFSHSTSTQSAHPLVPPRDHTLESRNIVPAIGLGNVVAPPGYLSVEPISKTGLGILSSPDADKKCLQRITKFCKSPGSGPLNPPGFDISLDDRHLIFETQVADFKLQQKILRIESLWKRVGEELQEKRLVIVEAKIVDKNGKVVGHVIPTDQQKKVADDSYHFILLSESQYWGNEKRIDVAGFPLYNVLVVQWDERKEFATRLGLGKIYKSAWQAAEPQMKRVILK